MPPPGCILRLTRRAGGRNRPLNALAASSLGADDGSVRRVVIVVFPGVQTLDVTGPAEVFRAATLLHPPGYEVIVAAAESEPLATSTVSFVPDARLDEVEGKIDTLLVAGGEGTRRAVADDALVDWIAGAATRSRRVAPRPP